MEARPPWHETTVPVTVDSVKQLERHALTRCTYFSIEQKTPGIPLDIQLGGDISIPVLLVNLSGVVVAPLGGTKTYFEDASDFDALFETIDNLPDLYVDTNDLWLPTQVLEQAGHPVERGQIYRISVELFRSAYAFRDDATSEKYLNSPLELLEARDPAGATFSIPETHAFKRWQSQVIEQIQQAYHAKPENKLKKKDDFDHPSPTPGLG